MLVVVLIGAAGMIFIAKPWNAFVSDTNKIEIEDQAFTNIEILANNAAIEIIPTKSSTTTVEYAGTKKKNSKYIFKANVEKETLIVQFTEKGGTSLVSIFHFPQWS